MKASIRRTLPIGAEVIPDQGTHFRVWAPKAKSVEVVVEASRETLSLAREEHGYFSGLLARGQAGMLYRFRLNGDDLLPDLASRYQPRGPLGPSQIIDPSKFEWTDSSWKGVKLPGQVFYEVHIGAFTPEGTWRAAAELLPELADVGITLLELMPVADFTGRYGWSYDGVSFFAPANAYGTPDDLRHFVDRAHAVGIGVILDVVYNHAGICGNYFKAFSPDYFTDRYENEWGDPINFDGPQSAHVREFVLSNVEYWIREFHLDGYRIDATQQIFDSSPSNIMREITDVARRSAGERSIVVIAESEPQDTKMVRPTDKGGFGMDAVWNDDFHHTAMVRLTGLIEAYFTDYRGSPDEFISSAKWGYLFQGQRYKWQNKPRGTPSLDLPAETFINYLQNHDQLANSGRGERIHQLTSPGRFRAMTAVLLLLPGTPLLFQGQEYCASQPFHYFTDIDKQLAAQVTAGRKKFLSQFRTLALEEMQRELADPSDPRTFERCKLDPRERQSNTTARNLHRDLLTLRRTDPVFAAQASRKIDAHVLSDDAFVLRYFGEQGDDRLLVVNFGVELCLDTAPYPLLAPAWDSCWAIHWSSQNPRYGGHGTPALETDDGWRIPSEAAIVLTSRPLPAAPQP